MSRVSIHAPVKGATAVPARDAAGAGFNPRAREGRDVVVRQLLEGRLVSIHAPVKGATWQGSEREVPLAFQSTRP